jgi:hypothetical protein
MKTSTANKCCTSFETATQSQTSLYVHNETEEREERKEKKRKETDKGKHLITQDTLSYKCFVNPSFNGIDNVYFEYG